MFSLTCCTLLALGAGQARPWKLACNDNGRYCIHLDQEWRSWQSGSLTTAFYAADKAALPQGALMEGQAIIAVAVYTGAAAGIGDDSLFARMSDMSAGVRDKSIQPVRVRLSTTGEVLSGLELSGRISNAWRQSDAAVRKLVLRYPRGLVSFTLEYLTTSAEHRTVLEKQFEGVVKSFDYRSSRR